MLSRHAPKLALLTGCVMLLLAAAMLVKVETASSADPLGDQRLRVQEVLAQSAPCLTCHTATASTPELVREITASHTGDDVVLAEATSSIIDQPSIKIVNAHLEDEMVAIGIRLLHVESRDAAQYTAAVDRFVAAAESVLAADDAISLASAQSALDHAEQLLIGLEQRTNPVKMKRTTTNMVRVLDSSHGSAPPSPLAAAALVVSGVVLPRDSAVSALAPDAHIVLPARFVAASHRRGPPAVVSTVESFERGRSL